MLRFLVLLLILANTSYWAWTQGWLASIGFAPSVQSEPQRIAAQIKPESIRVLSPAEAKRVEQQAAARPKPPECLQSELLSETVASALRSVTSALPEGSYSLQAQQEPARWILYMGKYPNGEALSRKKAELRELGVAFEVLRNPSLEPGLSLGAYAAKNEAEAQLSKLTRQGVRTARVLQESPERKGLVLRLPAVDEDFKTRLEPVKTALGEAKLIACKP